MSSRKRTRRQSPHPPASPGSRTRDEEVVVRLGGPPDLVAALPSMLGFVPEESLVVVAMHRRGGRSRVGGMARVDLVPEAAPHERAEVDRVLVAAVRQRLERAAPVSLVVVVVSEAAGAEPGEQPPHRALVEAVTAAFGELGVPVTGAVPAPEVAEPATLLAFATMDRGGGATLTTALERAMRADPGHQLSRLLGSVVAAGIDPDTVREMVAESAAESAARLTA